MKFINFIFKTMTPENNMSALFTVTLWLLTKILHNGNETVE